MNFTSILSTLRRAGLGLAAGLALLAAPAARAELNGLPITALTPTLNLAPGGQDTARFEFDLGFHGESFELLAFDLALIFDGNQLDIDVADVSMTFENGAPLLGGGELVTYDGPPGLVTFSWAYQDGELPVVPAGKGVLSVDLRNIGLQAGQTSVLTLGLVYSTGSADDLGSGTTVLVSAVPEPDSALLLVAGLGLFFLLRRRGAVQA